MIDIPSLADLAQAALGGGYAALSPAILAAASRPLRGGGTPAVSPSYPNEPSGMSEIFQYDGTTKDLGGDWFYDTKWGTHVSVITDATNPLGTGKSIRLDYDGINVACGLAAISEFDQSYDELYIMYRVFYDPGYDHFEKHFYVGNAIENRGSSPTQYYMTYRGSDEREWLINQHYGTETLWQTDANSTDLNGVWGELEWHLIAESTVGAGDGEARLYFDGDLLATTTSIEWNDPIGDTVVGFSGTQMFTGSGSVPSDDRWFKFGEWYMSGK